MTFVLLNHECRYNLDSDEMLARSQFPVYTWKPIKSISAMIIHLVFYIYKLVSFELFK